MLASLVDNVLRPLWGVWLMIIFVGIVFFAFRPRNKARLEEYGQIPLKDGNEER